MNPHYTLNREQWVPRSIEDTFAFFSDAGNLEELTPRWLKFRILTPQPIDMASGTWIRYRLAWHGIPIKWTTLITRWDPPCSFEDLQLSGPYKLWHHTHIFQPERGGTRITDIVQYALPLGLLGRVTHALSVRRNVEQIFDYRFQRIQAIFKTPDGQLTRGSAG
jgi:ligand-binding SRPBCC domain-containing protein